MLLINRLSNLLQNILQRLFSLIRGEFGGSLLGFGKLELLPLRISLYLLLLQQSLLLLLLLLSLFKLGLVLFLFLLLLDLGALLEHPVCSSHHWVS